MPPKKGKGSKVGPKDKVKTGGMVKRNAEGVAYPVNTSVLNPNADWRQSWDLWCMVLLIWCAIVTPVEIAFLEPKGLPDRPDPLWWLNKGVDLMFFIDMVLQFNTGYFSYKHGVWVVQHRKIIKSYCKGECRKSNNQALGKHALHLSRLPPSLPNPKQQPTPTKPSPTTRICPPPQDGS